MKIKWALSCMTVAACCISCHRDLEIDNNSNKDASITAPNHARMAGYVTNAALSPYDNLVLSDQPVAFWNNATVADVTGNGHQGVVLNAPTSKTLPNGDRSFQFNGVNQYIEVNDAPDLSVTATGILTLEAWVRPDVLTFPNMEGTGYVNWMGKGDAGQHEYVCRMYGQNPGGNDEGRTNRMVGNAFTLSGQSAAGSYYQPSSDRPITAGEWLHYVFVINTKAITSQYPYGYTKLYVQRKDGNGVLTIFEDQDALSNSALVAGTAPFRIGTRNLSSYFKGIIGKVAVYNYEIEKAIIIEHGKKMFDYDYLVLSDAPVAFWNTAGADITGKNHPGTIFNNPGITTLPNGDGALVFNGTSQYVEVGSKPDLSVPATGILTIDAWVRADVLTFEKMTGTGYVHWLGKRENGQCEYVARMYGQNPVGGDAGRVNRISGYAFNLAGDKGTGSYYQAATNWLIQTGEWIHYTLIINTVDTDPTHQTGYTKIYVHRKNSNGNIVTFEDKDALTNYDVIPEAGTAPFRIATEDLSSYFHGSIGKVAIYNYELSTAQSLEHAEKIFNP